MLEKVGVRWDIKKKEKKGKEKKKKEKETSILTQQVSCYTSHSSKLVRQIAKTELTYIICLYVYITKYFVHSLIRVCYYP